MKPEPLYYIPVPDTEQDIAGPYDLVQMAGLLRTKVISAETMTFREGEAEWIPFGNRPQYIVALETPEGVVSHRMEMQQHEQAAGGWVIPMPSAETLVMAGLALVGLFVAGVVSFIFAAGDTSVGTCLVVGGLGAAMVGQAMVYVKLLDEGWIVRLMVLFLPFFDIYYFVSNIHTYWRCFVAKYLGTVLAFTALAGLASGDPEFASQLRGILGI